MASHFSAVSCSSRRSGKFIPAATTSTSIPSDSPISSMVRLTASPSEMSSACAVTSRPSAPSAIASRRRAAAWTFAPASAKRLAVESPIPLLAPITSAVLPESGPLLCIYSPDPARKTFICADGPATRFAKAPGPSSRGKTGGSSPMPAFPSTSHSSACS